MLTLMGINSNSKKKSILLTAVIVVIYFYTSCFIYQKVSVEYMYLFKFKLDFNFNRLLLCIPYLAYSTYFIHKQLIKNNISNLFLIVITLLYFIPGAVLYIYGNFEEFYFIFYVLSFFVLTVFDTIIPNFKRKIRNENKKGLYQYAIILGTLTSLIVIYYNGINITLDLNNVYELREEWVNTKMPNIFNYYIPFAARITPIIIIILLARKDYVLGSFLVLSQLISFGFGGMKYTLFALVLALLVYYFFKAKTYYSIFYYIVVLNITATAEYLIFKNSLLGTYIIRRVSFIPNQIGYYYYDFFSKTDLLYYKESFLRFLGFKSPYDYPIPHIIGGHAFNHITMGANTGLFAEGYSQIGWFAMIVYPILYIMAFRFYEYCVGELRSDLSYKIAFLGVVLYSTSFIDGAFFSILLTQGFILTCLSLKFLSNYYSKPNKNYI